MPVLVAQRGHVARTRGATGGPYEQETARAVAAHLDRLMPHAGWTLRIIDADEPSHRYGGDAFVSIHTDAAASSAAVGASVGYRNAAGRQLAQRWKDAYRRHGWSRTFRSDNYTAALAGYYGHRHAVNQGNAAACIVELGFTTNPTERRILRSDAGRRRAALAICEAVTGSVPGDSTPDPEADPEEDDMAIDVVETEQAVYLVDHPYRIHVPDSDAADYYRDLAKSSSNREYRGPWQWSEDRVRLHPERQWTG